MGYSWEYRPCADAGQSGFISPEEEKNNPGLEGNRGGNRRGKCVLEEEAEDIHMNVEKLLIEKIGDTGQKLHACISA